MTPPPGTPTSHASTSATGRTATSRAATGRRPQLPARTASSRLIVVIRTDAPAAYVPLLEALVTGGVTSVELTLTTPGTLDALPTLLATFGADLDLGVGTITTPEELHRAAAAGAAYAVTPVTREDLLGAARETGLPIVPGGLTPTELHAGWAGGAAAVKVFPAGQVGPAYVRDLRGPFPDIEVIPSGGVDLDGARDWLAAGAAAVSVGGPLLGDAARGGDLGALTDRARAFVDLCRRAPDLPATVDPARPQNLPSPSDLPAIPAHDHPEDGHR